MGENDNDQEDQYKGKQQERVYRVQQVLVCSMKSLRLIDGCELRRLTAVICFMIDRQEGGRRGGRRFGFSNGR